MGPGRRPQPKLRVLPHTDGLLGSTVGVADFKHKLDPANIVLTPTSQLYIKEASPSSSSGLSAGAIAGIAVGAAAGAAALAAAMLALRARRRRQRTAAAGGDNFGKGSQADEAPAADFESLETCLDETTGMESGTTCGALDMAQGLKKVDADLESASAVLDLQLSIAPATGGTAGSSSDPDDLGSLFSAALLPAGLQEWVVDPASFTYLRRPDGKPQELGSGAW